MGTQCGDSCASSHRRLGSVIGFSQNILEHNEALQSLGTHDGLLLVVSVLLDLLLDE